MRFEFREAKPEDNSEICEIFRIPMGGSLALSLERDPDYFAGARVQNEKPRVFVGVDHEKHCLTGSFSVGERRVYLNGKPEWIPYFCDLRIRDEYRSGTLLARGYKFVKEEVLAGRYAQTIIVADNQEAINSLTGSRAGLPTYVPFGAYVTRAIPGNAASKMKYDASISIRKAQMADLGLMKSLCEEAGRQKQFYPCYDFEFSSPYFRDLSFDQYYIAYRNGSPVGMTGVWNQKSFKKTRICAYGRGLNLARPLYNAWMKLKGGISLPEPGSVLPYSYLHTVNTKNNDPQILRALVREIANDRDDAEYFLLGLDARDRLGDAFRGLSVREFHGFHYLVDAGAALPEPSLFYLEAARI